MAAFNRYVSLLEGISHQHPHFCWFNLYESPSNHLEVSHPKFVRSPVQPIRCGTRTPIGAFAKSGSIGPEAWPPGPGIDCKGLGKSWEIVTVGAVSTWIFFGGLKHSLSFLEGMTPYFFEILWNSASQDLHRYGKTVWFQKKIWSANGETSRLSMLRLAGWLSCLGEPKSAASKDGACCCTIHKRRCSPWGPPASYLARSIGPKIPSIWKLGTIWDRWIAQGSARDTSPGDPGDPGDGFKPLSTLSLEEEPETSIAVASYFRGHRCT